MKECIQCGAQMEDTHCFCKQCGTKQEVNQTQEIVSESVTELPKKNIKAKIFIAVVLLLAAICVACIVGATAMLSSTDDDSHNEIMLEHTMQDGRVFLIEDKTQKAFLATVDGKYFKQGAEQIEYSEDGKAAVYLLRDKADLEKDNASGNLYLWQKGKEPVFIEKDVIEYYISKDGNAVLYRTDDDVLYYHNRKEAIEIEKDVYSCTFAEKNIIVYTKRREDKGLDVYRQDYTNVSKKPQLVLENVYEIRGDSGYGEMFLIKNLKEDGGELYFYSDGKCEMIEQNVSNVIDFDIENKEIVYSVRGDNLKVEARNYIFDSEDYAQKDIEHLRATQCSAQEFWNENNLSEKDPENLQYKELFDQWEYMMWRDTRLIIRDQLDKNPIVEVATYDMIYRTADGKKQTIAANCRVPFADHCSIRDKVIYFYMPTEYVQYICVIEELSAFMLEIEGMFSAQGAKEAIQIAVEGTMLNDIILSNFGEEVTVDRVGIYDEVLVYPTKDKEGAYIIANAMGGQNVYYSKFGGSAQEIYISEKQLNDVWDLGENGVLTQTDSGDIGKLNEEKYTHVAKAKKLRPLPSKTEGSIIFIDDEKDVVYIYNGEGLVKIDKIAKDTQVSVSDDGIVYYEKDNEDEPNTLWAYKNGKAKCIA